MSEKRPSRPGQAAGRYVARKSSLGPPPVRPAGSLRARSVPVTPKPAAVPAVVPPKKVSPQVQLATAIAQNAVELTGVPLGSKKAKTLAAAIQLSVTKASSKSVSMSQLSKVLSKVHGPPPGIQHVMITFGALASAAVKVPNARVTEQLLLEKLPQDVVLPLVA